MHESQPRSLSEKHSQLTKEQILEAFTQQLEEGNEEATTETIAQHAQVSERTIYRHFPSRYDLIKAAGTWINDNRFSYVPTNHLDDITKNIKEVFERFDDSPALAYTIAQSRLGRKMRAGFRAKILTHTSDLIESSTPDLDDDEKTRAVAAISYLNNVLAWSTMREEFSFTAQQSSDTIIWMLDLVIDDIRSKQNSARPDQ